MKNTQDVTVITSFPPRGKTHGDQVVGIASYAKNTLRAILGAQEDTKINFNVMAERLSGQEEEYKDAGMNIKRIWKRSSFSIFPRLLKEIYENQKNSKTVFVEFELSMFGTLLYLIPFPIFLLILRLLGKQIIFVAHQVVPDIDEIAPHINVTTGSFKSDVMDGILKLFYTFIVLISQKVIVFEEDLKDRLEDIAIFDLSKKIKVIPHGVEEFKRIPSKLEARKKLGIDQNSFVIMSFGFLAWYKGTDWITHAVNQIQSNKRFKNQNIQLILAGGPNPNNTDKPYYKRYIKNVLNESKKGRTIVTGFVKETDIPLYFKACDLVVLPYRTFMSASGPLSIAFSFKKPFLLSPVLSGSLSSKDMKIALSDLKLEEEDLIFKLDGDFRKKLIRLKGRSILRRKIEKLSSEIKRARSWNVIGAKYYEEIIN